ncbi:MAG: DUF4328 domain-containing protein, partial [Verrucomicrobiae bacterium]|nr:DUF4328 domain-containing protein [Verrucomicrobiae bacterium]
MEWYAAKEGTQLGPLTEPSLAEMVRSGELSGESLVWREGLADWMPLATARPDWFPDSPAPASQIGEAMATCSVSGTVLHQSQMLQYGNEWVAPEFKEAFLQELREGAAPVPATPHQGGFIYRDPRTRATLAKVTILVWTILGALVTSIDLATPDSAPDEFTTADGALAFFGLAMLPTFILSVVFFCMWTHRVMANSYAFGGKWNEITPGWAVGWYFIPFANLVKPYHGLKQAWQSTHDDPEVPAILPTWWGLWIVSNIAGNIS